MSLYQIVPLMWFPGPNGHWSVKLWISYTFWSGKVLNRGPFTWQTLSLMWTSCEHVTNQFISGYLPAPFEVCIVPYGALFHVIKRFFDVQIVQSLLFKFRFEILFDVLMWEQHVTLMSHSTWTSKLTPTLFDGLFPFSLKWPDLLYKQPPFQGHFSRDWPCQAFISTS